MYAEENSTCNFSGARDDSWLMTGRGPIWYVQPTLIATASNGEKWSSVTNGRTLILIVPREIYLSNRRARLIFETSNVRQRAQ